MTTPHFDTQHVTLDASDLEGSDPARYAQIAVLMMRLGSFLGHFPTARAHVRLWEDDVVKNLHLEVEMVLGDEEMET